MDFWLWLLIFFFIFIILALVVVVVLEYNKITDTNELPYIIYGITPNNCNTVNSTTKIGVMAQNQNNVQLSNVSTIGDLSSQWYFIPTTLIHNIFLQNAASKEYIHIDPSNSTITMTADITNASPLYWTLNGTNNINFFQFISPVSNGCVDNIQYLTFTGGVNALLSMQCPTNTTTNVWWLPIPTIPIIAT